MPRLIVHVAISSGEVVYPQLAENYKMDRPGSGRTFHLDL